MKLFLFFILISLASCTSLKVTNTQNTEIKDGLFYELKQENPYSGIVASFYDKDKKKIKEKRYYEDGILYKVKEWDKEGLKKQEKPIWVYQYSAYEITDGEKEKKVFLSVGKSSNKDNSIKEAKKSMIFLLKYYRKIFKELSREYVDLGDLKENIYSKSLKILENNKILSNNFENLISQTFLSKELLIKNVSFVQLSLDFDKILSSISKLELPEEFKKLSKEILNKSYQQFKKTWLKYLRNIENLKIKNKEEIKKMMSAKDIKRYELDFFETGEKKELKYFQKEHTIFIEWYKNGNKKSKKIYNLRNELDGKHLLWYENDKLKEKSEYKNSKLNSEFKKYYKNGNKKEEGKYLDGKIIGEYLTYHENKTIKEKKTYDNGNLVSINSFYKSGNKKSYVTYFNNKIEGFKFVYHNKEDSPIKEESIYVNGLLEGDYKSYHENGKKQERGKYSEGKKIDKFTGYHDNGKRAYSVNFKDGLMDGYYNAWYSNGKRAERGKYKMGKKVSYFTLWYENGRKKEYTKYKNGKKDGKSITWSKEGKKTITKYSNGEELK